MVRHKKTSGKSNTRFDYARHESDEEEESNGGSSTPQQHSVAGFQLSAGDFLGDEDQVTGLFGEISDLDRQYASTPANRQDNPAVRGLYRPPVPVPGHYGQPLASPGGPYGQHQAVPGPYGQHQAVPDDPWEPYQAVPGLYGQQQSIPGQYLQHQAATVSTVSRSSCSTPTTTGPRFATVTTAGQSATPGRHAQASVVTSTATTQPRFAGIDPRVLRFAPGTFPDQSQFIPGGTYDSNVNTEVSGSYPGVIPGDTQNRQYDSHVSVNDYMQVNGPSPVITGDLRDPNYVADDMLNHPTAIPCGQRNAQVTPGDHRRTDVTPRDQRRSKVIPDDHRGTNVTPRDQRRQHIASEITGSQPYVVTTPSGNRFGTPSSHRVATPGIPGLHYDAETTPVQHLAPVQYFAKPTGNMQYQGEVDNNTLPGQHSAPIAMNTLYRTRGNSAQEEVAEHYVHNRELVNNRDYVPRRPKIPAWKKTFSGRSTETFGQYLAHLEYYSKQSGLNDSEKISLLVNSLEGNAARVVTQLRDHDTWSEVVRKLGDICNPPERRSMLSATFDQRYRRKDETAEDYSLALEDLANRAFGHYHRDIVQERVRLQFLRGQPAGLRRQLAPQPFAHIEDMVTAVMMAETYSQEDYRKPTGRPQKPIRELREECDTDISVSDFRDNVMYREIASELRAIRQDLAKQNQAPEDDTEVKDWVNMSICMSPLTEENEYDECDIYAILDIKMPDNGRRMNPMTCFYCKGKGHGWRNCYKLRELLRQNGMTTSFVAGRNRNRSNTDVPVTPVSTANNTPGN